MFNTLSPSYDRINHILSLGFDFYWRKRASSCLPPLKPLRILDAATGTCDQLIALMAHHPHIISAVGVDASSKMLKIGEKKIAKKPYTSKVLLKEESIDCLSFSDYSFEAVTLSFGIRNVVDVPSCLKELHRVLTIGGRLVILEFSLPASKLLRQLHLFYLRHVVPKVGAALSKSAFAYRYLNETIETFPYGEAFCKILENANFQEVKATPLSGGIVTIYEAVKC